MAGAGRQAAPPARGRHVTALGLVAEIGTDWSRFQSAEQFMSFVGLVPSEAPAEQRSQGSISKAGNGHLRRLLVEAAWRQRQRPASARSSPPASAARTRSCFELAWSAQQRLHRRWQRMAGRGKFSVPFTRFSATPARGC